MKAWIGLSKKTVVMKKIMANHQKTNDLLLAIYKCYVLTQSFARGSYFNDFFCIPSDFCHTHKYNKELKPSQEHP